MVGDPPDEWWVDESFRRIDRRPRDGEREACLDAYDRIKDLPGFAEDEARVDTSLEANREIVTRWLVDVGVASDLAEVMWALDCEPAAWPIDPDVPEVVRGIRERGVKSALVSDFHVDLRPHLRANGVELDAYVISFEHGFQKPDPRMFITALDALDVARERALMVGDRASHDGGAAAVGIDTLILPAPASFGPRGLDVVLKLLD